MLTVANKFSMLNVVMLSAVMLNVMAPRGVYEETGLLGEDDTQGIGAGVLKIKIKKKHIFLSKN